MGSHNRSAHIVSVHRDGVALHRQFRDQRANARFIVGIGTFERGNFAVHHAFKLAGPRHGTFDAITDGRDLAADRLTQVENAVGGCSFRFSKAERYIAQSVGGIAHFARPAEQRGDAEKHQNRRQQQKRRQTVFPPFKRQPPIRFVKQGADVARIEISAASSDPSEGQQPRQQKGGAR